jgi:hypothetical protein
MRPQRIVEAATGITMPNASSSSPEKAKPHMFALMANHPTQQTQQTDDIRN